MPFGLTNAPAAFQHFMNDILRDILDVYVIVYLDDILVYSKNKEEHESHVREVLRRLREHHLYLKISKCFLGVDTVPYLGMIISPQGISMDNEKVKAVQEWPQPKSVKDVQSFLGFANFYRRFIPDFSSIARPLHDLTRKTQVWAWDRTHQGAFDTIKERMSTGPVLEHPDPEKQFVLETDASGVAMGAVLSQKGIDGRLHPVAYMSHSFSPAERNYDTHDKELLAIIWALLEWCLYLEGTKEQILVLTDHRNLEYWKTTQRFNRRHSRWALLLADYDFVIAYRPGKQSEKPDELSRRADHQESDETLPGQVMLKPSTFVQLNTLEPLWEIEDRIRVAIQDDQSLEAILTFLSSDPGKAPKTVQEKFKRYTWIDGLLRYDGKIMVPDDDELKRVILESLHDAPTAGHPGRERTRELVSRTYYWPALTSWVHCYVDGCDTCQRNKVTRGQPVPAQPLNTPEGPWEEVEYDMIVKLPVSNRFDSILTFSDRLTKMSHFIPCNESMTAEEVAELFLTHVWKLHGTLKKTISDRGPTFNAHFLRAVYERLNIEPHFSSAYHPQTDGQSERTNQSLEQYLRMYVDHRQTDWSRWLPLAEFAFNNAVNRTTGQSPFFANTARNPVITPSSVASSVPAADSMTETIREVQEEIKASMRMSQDSEKDGRADVTFEAGDRVWHSAKHIGTQRPSKKLDWKRLGPYPVMERIGKTAFRLQLPKLMKIHNVFHASLLSLHRPNTIPGRAFEEPPAVETKEGEEEYEVERILDARRFRRQLQYLVKWVGYPPSEQSWEPASSLSNAQDAIAEFRAEYPDATK